MRICASNNWHVVDKDVCGSIESTGASVTARRRAELKSRAKGSFVDDCLTELYVARIPRIDI